MFYDKDYIRKIAEFKFGKNDKARIRKYIKDFNPSSSDCIEDEKQYAKTQTSVEKQTGDARQRFRVEDYFIRKFIYDFYTGEVKVFAFTLGGKSLNKEDAEKIKFNTTDPLEQKLADWVSKGFSDHPVKVEEGISYADAVNRFSEKYGINLKPENIVSAIKDIAMQGEEKENVYRQYYKCMFSSIYCQSRPEDHTKIADMCLDFENIMNGIRKEETGKDKIPAMHGRTFAFGGLHKEELREFLLSFREVEFDLTKKAQKELSGAQGKELGRRVSISVKKIIDGDQNQAEKMTRCAAQLQALERMHASRPSNYWITSPIKNIQEKLAIKDLKKMMSDAKFDMKRVEELEKQNSVYGIGFNEEKEKIDKFCDDIGILIPDENEEEIEPLIIPLNNEPQEKTKIEPPMSETLENDLSDPEIIPDVPVLNPQNNK